MKRTHTPQRLKILSVVLALLVGVFLLSPAVTANEAGSNDNDGLYVGGRTGGGGGGNNQGSGGHGGDDTDPDWWTMSIWFQIQGSETVETPAIRPAQVAGPFGGFISWLLQEASSQYLRLWK